MNYKTHTIGGLFTGISVLSILSNNFNIVSAEGIVFVSGSVVGSLIPDIDHKGSYFGRRARITSTILNKTLGHRGATHSPIVTTIVMGIIYMILRKFVDSHLLGFLFGGLYIGILSHIFLDFLTKGGVSLLYPFTKKKFSLLRFSTGGFMEKVFFVAMLMGSCILTVKNFI